MTFDEFFKASRLSNSAKKYALEWYAKGMTLEEMVTSTCDRCGIIIHIFPDGRWRFQQHPIRCVPCQKRLIREYGLTSYEVEYVT